MLQEFQVLNNEERELLFDSIPLITILIAGADDEIDEKETEWAEKILKIRTYDHPDRLTHFYKEITQIYNQRLSHYLELLPNYAAERNPAISSMLEGLNTILPKIEVELAALFYRDLVTFANHVAKASGGVLGFFSIGSEEHKWVDLPMINPIEAPES